VNDEPSSDLGLIEQIGVAFDELPPVPRALHTAALEAFQWRRADVELAELLFDSASEELVGVRGTSTDRRSFRYRAGDFVIRIHLTAATMIVMIEPPLSVACRIASGDRGEASNVEHHTDELGELVVDVPTLPIRVEVDMPGGTVATPWIIG
jgi:hypothetical protein